MTLCNKAKLLLLVGGMFFVGLAQADTQGYEVYDESQQPVLLNGDELAIPFGSDEGESSSDVLVLEQAALADGQPCNPGFVRLASGAGCTPLD